MRHAASLCLKFLARTARPQHVEHREAHSIKQIKELFRLK